MLILQDIQKRMKILLFFMIIFYSISGYAKSIIPMENENGVFRIPCLINGARVKLIFDTGASVVSLSMPMAEYLYDNGYITDDDIYGVGQSTTADGRIVDHLKLNIKKIVIGVVELDNVEAVVIASQDAPLLLGQSAIQKLGKIELEGNNLIITNGGELSDNDIDYLGDLADQAMKDEDYQSAVKYYGILYDSEALTDYGLLELAHACLYTEEYVRALKYFSELINTKYGKPEGYNAINAQFNLFFLIADCYLQQDKWDYAIINLDKALELAAHVDCARTKLNNNMICETICENFAVSLWQKKYYDKAADYFYKALEYWGKSHNMSAKQVWQNCIAKTPSSSFKNNDRILNLAANYAESQFYSYRWNDFEIEHAMIALARNGCNNARIFCNTNKISY